MDELFSVPIGGCASTKLNAALTLPFADVLSYELAQDSTTVIYTAGPVPSQISVDGLVRDRWGLTWMKLDPGSYEVCFGDISGWRAPPCTTVNIAAGSTAVAQGDFSLQGSLRVTTQPPSASTISVDGIPRNDWGMWTDIESGIYEICWGHAKGFTPPCQSATVTPGVTTQVDGIWPP